jgi:hypothetical protein
VRRREARRRAMIVGIRHTLTSRLWVVGNHTLFARFTPDSVDNPASASMHSTFPSILDNEGRWYIAGSCLSCIKYRYATNAASYGEQAREPIPKSKTSQPEVRISGVPSNLRTYTSNAGEVCKYSDSSYATNP